MTINYPVQITIHGIPRTKKNSQISVPYGAKRIIQNKRYVDYETMCIHSILCQYPQYRGAQISEPVNVKIHIYKKDRIKSDQSGYIQAIDDILVRAGILADDNFNIVKSHDGTRVYIDKDDPRVEITITKFVD